MAAPALLLVLLAAAAVAGAVGSAVALRQLYRECGGRVMAVALRILGDRAEAEDIVQETFLELWRRAAAYDPARSAPATWAVLVARSRALDRLRSRASAARACEASGHDPSLHPAVEPVEARQDRERVRRALDELPPEQRETLELAYFEGLTHGEIASRTGLPLGTVKTRLRLAMAKLRTNLAPAPEETA